MPGLLPFAQRADERLAAGLAPVGLGPVPVRHTDLRGLLVGLRPVHALKAAGVHEAFASVFDAASERVMEAADDPFDFDERLHADNLAGAAGDVRRAFTWL
ncbi:hypothetical protein ACFXPY_46220 [Streptomyces sp. NPDC059153]|uniref:hypothetical protein n=1 Tax=unclassified Streptomyces TaxID=2593676 RepID=UPI0036C045A6